MKSSPTARSIVLAIYVMSSSTMLMSDIGLAADESDRNVITVRGRNGESKKFTIEELRALPRSDVEATDRKGEKVKYRGVTVQTLLEKVGTAHGATLRGEWVRAFVAVDAHDKYRAVYALPEFDADFTDRIIILAYERDGQPLEENTGPLQIIVPGEKKHARWVRMVKEIRVVDSALIKD